MLIEEKACSVAILMATFNGVLYLKNQIRSIIDQDYSNWRLYVRDDESSDDTVKLINEFVINDDRITLISDDHGNLGPTHNFELLLKHVLNSGERYVCFADQDDVWDSEKISTLLVEMMAVEKSSRNLPVLVHSDLCVTDQSLRVLHSSFMQYQHVHHENKCPLSVLLAQNFVTGCTVMMNRRLLEVALPIPREALMHDWWLALCAAAFGHIGYIDKALMKYRQHGSNEVGAKSIKNYLNPFKTNWMDHWFKGRGNFVRSVHQVRIVVERIKEYDPENSNLELIESYATLLALPRWQRIKMLKKNGIHCQSWLRHCLMLSRLLSISEQK